MKQVDEHVRRARTDWQQRIPEKPRQTEDFLWAINMPQTRSWKAARGYSLLRVEYNSPWDWQAALSVAFHQQLQSEALEVIWGLAPTDVQELQGGAWKTLLPRILLAQLLSLHPECIPLMDNAILSLRADDTFHVEDNRERLDASWKNSFCSANSPWQHQWIILSCALQCLHEGIALMLVGFNDELYQTLDEGLRYLDHKHYANPSKSDPGNFFSTRCKALIVGTPRSEAFRRDKQFDTLASLSSRIDEDVEREVCLSSLHFPELHARRDRVEKSEKGTTQWIWKHPAYANWCGQDSSLLWIHGKPGSGKSTLAAALQRSLSKDIQGLLLADFFYSSRGGPTETGHCWMLRSILYQLLQRQATLYPFYKLAFRKFQASEFGSWKYELLEEMLLSLQNPTGDDDVNRTFLLILDGLDESEDGDSARTSRQRSLQLFSRLSCSERKIVFKVIALSRPEPLIKHALRPTYSIDMKDENKADIERIARYGISRLWRHLYFGSDDSETKPTSTALSPDGPSTYNAASIEMEDVEDIPQLDFVRDYLLKHADGVILWVVMVLREIGSIAKSGACTMAQLEAELSKIPTSLGELYQDIFDRLKSSPYSSPDQASYVFSWLLFTQETLKVCEIRDAMAMFYWNDSSDDKRGEFLKTHRVLQYGGRWDPTWTLLTNLCGGFVEIVPQERSAAGTLWVDRTIDPDDSVQLIHRTARDFLIFDSGSAFLNLSSSRCLDSLCTTCVNYLELAFTVVLDTEIEIAWKSFILHLEDRPLLRYILGNLPSMLEQNCKSNAATISLYRRISQYIADAWWSRRSSVTWWFLKQWSRRHFILDSDGKLQIKFPDNFDVSIFVDLDEENDEVTTTGTAPAKSSECYQSSFVRNLKARASQCEAWNAVLSDFIPNSLLSDGLVYASKFGCPGALRVLLAAGAEKNGLLENPLCKAAMSGHHAIVRILLEEGAAHGINSMKSAVLGGNVLLVKELLLSSHFVSKTSRQDRSDIRALAGSLGESKAEIKALLEEYLTSHPDDSELSSPRLDTDDEMIQGSLINAPELSDISGSVSTPTTISDQSFEDVDRDASASGTMFRVWKRVSFAVP
ncbi:hypothetical protein BKA64DRAFT_226507 [Cadophora sp. MPI-SDFR-AT-0126]|nr:hypothetical protein BKA64DRAFT_226507 [Leotiomycetes sp. MPI-SDFR-AT-0126]